VDHDTVLVDWRRNAKAHDNENYEFLRSLKFRDYGFDPDELAAELHERAFQIVDCTRCANCCKTLGIKVSTSDAERIAEHLSMATDAFVEAYLATDEDSHRKFRQQPCPFLDEDNRCTIYDVRPTDCREYPHTDKDAEKAMQLSLRWAARSRKAFGTQPGRGNFGIVQGGVSEGLRRTSAEGLREIGFEGYAIGGLAVGEGQKLMLQTIEFTAPELPADKPRYLMGVGTPEDLLESVGRGIDMFDCVMPTRSGRHGQAFTRFGKVNLRNAKHAGDPRPLDAESTCPALSKYSRAYIHHLMRSGELLGMMLLSWANVAYYQELMQGIRAAIAEDRFDEFRDLTKEQWKRGED